ncbi:hypothetical protein [Bradyrhizobium sp.]|uniref:hypothetical protein n=1 Tax=Bradyrhizobium sp. TaxID=376 RepID=UPI00391DADB2
MVQSITPSPSVSAVRGVGSSPAGNAPQAAATLQAGALLSARVQQVLAENLVQVAIGNLSMELASELPLQAGQTVQVAVSQTGQGLQLAIVGPGNGAAAGTSGTSTPFASPIARCPGPASLWARAWAVPLASRRSPADPQWP